MSSCFIVFLIFPLFVHCEQYQTKKFQKVTYKSEIHKRLVNHVYKITHGNDPQHCLSDCWAENHICQSFNYLALLDLCELSNSSAIDFPSDLTTYDMSVYFTNPAFGDKVAPSTERNNITYPSSPPDVCASGPCKSGQCVLDDKIGFRCVNCSAGYYGKMCEQIKDPCSSSPCLHGGVCTSQPDTSSITCACTTRFSGLRCEDGTADYDFNLESPSQYPQYKMDNSISLSQMTLCFWYKTSQTLSYFISYTPDDAQRNEQILIWRNETKVYVRLGDSDIQSFDDFQFIDDNAWNHLCVTWNITGQMTLYSQGAQRNDAKLAISGSFQLSPGIFYLGYYAHPTDGSQYFTGHISQLNIWDYVKNTSEILALSEACLSEPGNVWNWTNIMWTGGNILKPGATCTTRVPTKSYNVFKFIPHASYIAKLLITSDENVNTDSLTISVWFRLASTNINMRIIELNRASTPRIYLRYTATGIRFKLNNEQVTVKLPIFKSTWYHLVVIWSGLNDTAEFILNGVWQIWKKNAFLLSSISENLQAAVGIYDAGGDEKFNGEIANVNVWKRKLPVAYIVAMSKYAGDDIGDLFAWKTFSASFPTSVCHEFIMERHEHIVRERPTRLTFTKNSYSVETRAMSPSSVTELTICLWLKLSSFAPVKLITHKPISSNTVALEIVIDANQLKLKMSGDSRGISSVLQNSYKDQWQHLCVAWTNAGLKLLSWFRWVSLELPAFRTGQSLDFQGPWIIGKNANGQNIEGSIAHVNIWSTYLTTYLTLFNGVMNLEGDLVAWPQFVNQSLPREDVTLGFADELFLPDWDVLLKRDLYCASFDSAKCYEYARTAWDLKGFTWACVCPAALNTRGIATHQELNSSLSAFLPGLATMN